jgi:hypothetical protein
MIISENISENKIDQFQYRVDSPTPPPANT